MLINAWNYGNILAKNGQVLIGQGSTNPVASFLTSSSQTLTFILAPGLIDIELNTGNSFFNPLQIGNGGTGHTILTTFGVLIGEGSNGVNVTAAGTNGQVLIASSTGDPKFSKITSTGGTLTFTFGYNSLNMDLAIAGFTFLNPWPVQNGGTGRTILTTYGVLIGAGSNSVHVTAAGTNGQLLIASSTGDPQFSTITSTGGTITFTFGYNSLNAELNFNTPFPVPVTFVSGTVASYSVVSSDYFLAVSTNIARTIFLPNTTTKGRVIVVKDRTGTANTGNITVQAVSATVTIDNSASINMNTKFQAVQFLFDGTVYEMF